VVVFNSVFAPLIWFYTGILLIAMSRLGFSCNERDVLMGRGKRVSEWPGNIYFRQVVNKYRERYAKSARTVKVTIAQTVIDEIHQVNGRFLKEERDGSWNEVEADRTVEKTCQALREKEKSNPAPMSPFVDTAGHPQRKRAKLQPALKRPPSSDENSVESIGDDTATESDESSEDETETESEEEEVNVCPPKRAASKGPTPLSTVKQKPNEEWLEQVQKYAIKYKHLAVPPGWSENVKFADWCVGMRLLRRELDLGYRRVSTAERDILGDLEERGFVWDYEAWHWEKRYKELQETLNMGPHENLKDTTLHWLDNQRRLGRASIPTDRLEKLQKLGIYL
jgi:hypothetical protein